MAAAYSFVLDGARLHNFLNLKAGQRRQLIGHFDNLSANPYQKGETSSHDSSGREIQKKVFGQWLIAFWADHAVKEVRIAGFWKIAGLR